MFVDCSTSFRPLATVALTFAIATSCHAQSDVDAAIASVTASELYDHVATLADDVFEGRAVGSRGGRAAAQYIVEQLRRYDATPAGDDGEYFHACRRGGRNVLATWPGHDPHLSQEYVVIGAHYDHVGDGSQGHARGAIGQIYNGADDNASGVAALLELIEACSDNVLPTRRSILFAFWDGEEQGMLGSSDWVAQPTVPLRSVRLAINVDMIGRLRDGRLHVLGTRTGYGLRRLLSGSVADPLWLDFSWELTANSDHWTFLDRQIPIAMIHTGVHDDYHRPGDDADKVNRQGLEEISRYLLATVVEAANASELPSYRPAGRTESLASQRRTQRRQSLVSRSGQPVRASEPGRPRPRLGITWRTDDAEPASVYLTHVLEDSPAAVAGLAAGDRIYAVNDQSFADTTEFGRVVNGLLDAGTAEFTLLVETRGRLRTVAVHWHPPASLPVTLAVTPST
jgi:hypothetical protein